MQHGDRTRLDEQVCQLDRFLVIAARRIPQVENDIRGTLFQERVQLPLGFCGFARSKVWNFDIRNVVLQHPRFNGGRLNDFTRDIDRFRVSPPALDDG